MSPSTAPAADVAIVVVTHDTCAEALGCLGTVQDAAADLAVEVVVVDTGSRDATVDAVRARHPRVRVLELANTGFGRGANAGIRMTGAPVVVVCNADVRFDPGAIAVMHEVLVAMRRVAAVGPAVRYPDGTPQASARRTPDRRTAVLHALLGRIAPDNAATRHYHGRDLDTGRARDVDWVSGCALALRRQALEEVGGFDPGFFLFLEDVELAERLRAAGWRVRHEPSARVTHRVGASTGERRWWSLRAHAVSLDRYVTRRGTGRARPPWWRPLLRVALTLWVVVTYLHERWRDGEGDRGRSTTGERITLVGPVADETVDPWRDARTRSDT